MAIWDTTLNNKPEARLTRYRALDITFIDLIYFQSGLELQNLVLMRVKRPRRIRRAIMPEY